MAEQNFSIVETFHIMRDFRWDDKDMEIVDMPDRIGEIDYEQESFRLSYNNYLHDVAYVAAMRQAYRESTALMPGLIASLERI